jgi:hypothetical protein
MRIKQEKSVDLDKISGFGHVGVEPKFLQDAAGR